MPNPGNEGQANAPIVKVKPTTKLTPEQVLDIYTGERSQREYAAAYGISRANVQLIQHGKSWSWLTSTYEGTIWRAANARGVGNGR